MSLESGQRTGDPELWTGVEAEADQVMRRGLDDAVATVGRPADKQAETQAYEDAVKKAFGGKKGMADVGLPALVFLIIYTATKQLTPALWASVGVAAVL